MAHLGFSTTPYEDRLRAERSATAGQNAALWGELGRLEKENRALSAALAEARAALEARSAELQASKARHEKERAALLESLAGAGAEEPPRS